MAILFDDGSIVFDDGGIVFADDPEECDCCGPPPGDCEDCQNGNSTERVQITVAGVINEAAATFCDEEHACSEWNTVYTLPDDYIDDVDRDFGCDFGTGNLFNCPDATYCDTGGVRYIRRGINWDIFSPSESTVAGLPAGYNILVTLRILVCVPNGFGGWTSGGGRSIRFLYNVGENPPNCLSGVYVLTYNTETGDDSVTCDFTGATATLSFI